MRPLRRSSVLAAVLLVLILPGSAHAVSNRIFMSTNGSDSSDCANPLSPCLTFAGALAQVNPGGEVIAEATGGYGALNITKAVMISGPPGVVIYSGLSVTINAPGATVVLRGLTIDGTGASANGVNVLAAAVVHVENCLIRGFSGFSLTSGSGVNVNVNTDMDLLIADTVIQDNGGDAVILQANAGTTRATIQRCRFVRVGIGLQALAGSEVIIRDTEVTHNGTGLQGFSNARLWIDNCLVGYNVFGITGADPQTVIRLSNSTIVGNQTALVNDSGTFTTRSNNTVVDNPSGNGGTITTFPPF